MGFWSNFWGFVKKKIDQYDEEKKIVVKVQDWENITEYNPLAIANTKLTSLVCDEATVELQTDSTLVEPLKPLANVLAVNTTSGAMITHAKKAGNRRLIARFAVACQGTIMTQMKVSSISCPVPTHFVQYMTSG